MYIAHNRERKLNFLLAVLAFTIITTLVAFNSLTLVVINNTLQTSLNLILNISLLNQLFAVLGGSLMCTVYILLLWFFLWGFKHKLIAAWLLATYFSGQIAFWLVRLLIHQSHLINVAPTNLGVTFPSWHLFSLILIDYCIYTAVLPLIKTKQQIRMIKIGIWLITLLVILTNIQLHLALPIDIMGSFLLAYAWLQLWQEQYLIHFNRLSNYKLFRHSDYN